MQARSKAQNRVASTTGAVWQAPAHNLQPFAIFFGDDGSVRCCRNARIVNLHWLLGTPDHHLLIVKYSSVAVYFSLPNAARTHNRRQHPRHTRINATSRRVSSPRRVLCPVDKAARDRVRSSTQRKP